MLHTARKSAIKRPMKILVIQNSELDPIGILGEHLVALGAELFVWLTEQQPSPLKQNYDSLIVLGGSMNAHEDEKFPYLSQVVDLIRQFHVERKPVMGICLGAQLIARAFGSQVYPHVVPELGFCQVRLADKTVLENIPQEPWLKDLPDELQVMQWHFDTFNLPTEALLLMTNEVCKYQAYRIGHNIYGFQFHFEVTPEIIRRWLAAKEDWIEANYPHLDSEIESQVQRYAKGSAQFAKSVAQYWMTLRPDAIAA